jgi:D-alanyl-lipoteichoic acid acyltransferase DltB (MBOAT superfamily)
MLFHTWTFALFFPAAFVGHLILRRTRLKLLWLLAASYVFYAWWNPLYLLLLAHATVIDWLAVTFMARSRRRWVWLAFSVLNNVTILAFFKYAGFIAGNVNAILGALGVDYQLPTLGLLLPVGVSFYTFCSLSYTIDFYRGQIEREPSLLRYATFGSLFPQLVAGPIERAGHLLPQLREENRITRADVTDGLSLFLVGLFKKIALADFLAKYVDQAYAAPDQAAGVALALATFAFGWQIYFDFSGYTDMARGVARMMGFRLLLNFRNPYLADGLGDFWNRWHISLSSWFKRYVYIPLGGNRHGSVRTYVNMALTMLISGLWHGASWTFVIWAALHAFGRFLTRELERTPFYARRVPRLVKQIAVFAFVTLAWVFFRAPTLHDAGVILRRIFTSGLADPRFPVLALGLVLSVWIYQYVCESPLRRLLQWAPVTIAMAVFLIIYLTICPEGGGQPFIYFQF